MMMMMVVVMMIMMEVMMVMIFSKTIISCCGVNLALVPSGTVVAFLQPQWLCIHWCVDCHTTELCFCLSSSLKENRTLVNLL